MSLSNERKVFEMIITIGINIVENYQFEKPFHIHHPCRDVLTDSTGDIFITSIILEECPVCLFVTTNQCGEIFHLIFSSVIHDVESLSNIYHLTVFGETQTVICGYDTIHLPCYLHGKMFIGRYLLTGRYRFIPWSSQRTPTFCDDIGMRNLVSVGCICKGRYTVVHVLLNGVIDRAFAGTGTTDRKSTR